MAYVEIIGQQPLVEVTPSEPAEVTITPGGNIRMNVVVVDAGETTVNVAATQGPQGIQGIPGVAGPNQVTTTTATNINGILAGNGTTVEEAQIASGRLLGRSSAGTGDIEQITIGAGLQLSGGQLISTATGVPSGTASGTDTYTATIANVTGYNTNDGFIIKFTNSNTSTATLNINGLGAKNIFKSVNVALSSGDIKAGQELVVVYDGTNFQAIGLAPTKAEVGLGNVDNTSDLNKPISTATQTALNAKQDTLVSGNNIKTVNGSSLVGSGGINVGTVTSVGLSMPSAFTVSNSPVIGSGTINVVGAGTTSQYIRGDGQLATLPSSPSGGGASISYYLNGSVNASVATYKQLSRNPVIGAGTDFSTSTNGLIAQFLTDAGDPNILNLPGGNFLLDFYFSASTAGGTPNFYVELYKYDGTTFTLIASNSATPEFITNGTAIDFYTTSLAVPTTTFALTDRLAIRVYVACDGRTITLHTENNHLSEVVTTLSTGISALNGLVAQVQNLATGTSGNDFGISSTSSTHTFNLPIASATNTGKLSSTDWSTFNNKENAITAGTTSQYFRGDKTFQTLDKAAVGLGNVDNTSDLNKPISTNTQAALNGKQDTLTNPVTGTGTNNEIAFFNTTGSTIGSLSTATYPSLTELSYLKGATSSIQAQLDAIDTDFSGGRLYLFYSY